MHVFGKNVISCENYANVFWQLGGGEIEYIHKLYQRTYVSTDWQTKLSKVASHLKVPTPLPPMKLRPCLRQLSHFTRTFFDQLVVRRRCEERRNACRLGPIFVKIHPEDIPTGRIRRLSTHGFTGPKQQWKVIFLAHSYSVKMRLSFSEETPRPVLHLCWKISRVLEAKHRFSAAEERISADGISGFCLLQRQNQTSWPTSGPEN